MCGVLPATAMVSWSTSPKEKSKSRVRSSRGRPLGGTLIALAERGLDAAGNRSSGIAGIYSFTSDTGADRNSVGGMDAATLLLLALGWWRRSIGDGFKIRPLRSR